MARLKKKISLFVIGLALGIVLYSLFESLLALASLAALAIVSLIYY